MGRGTNGASPVYYKGKFGAYGIKWFLMYTEPTSFWDLYTNTRTLNLALKGLGLCLFMPINPCLQSKELLLVSKEGGELSGSTSEPGFNFSAPAEIQDH